MQILIAILALSFLIVVHEFGHFIVAKLSGIRVHEFALFMGPKIFSVKIGETDYSLRAVPLGGFVKMEGEEEASEDSRAFNKKPISVRAAVIAAGPIMNLITAVIIITALMFNSGFNTTVITKVRDGSPLQQAGITNGDRLLNLDGKKVYHPMDLEIISYVPASESSIVEVQRGNDVIRKTIQPQRDTYRLGFRPAAEAGKDSNLVIEVVPNSPAEQAGLKKDDRIIALNDTKVTSRQDVGDYLNKNKENPVKILVQRGVNTVELQPVVAKLEKNPAQIALGIDAFEHRTGGIVETIESSVIYAYSTTRSVYYSFAWLVTGKVSLNQLMGPVGIVSTIGDVVQQSPTIIDKIVGLLSFTAFISINLGIFNLIPFPALDGSKLLLLGVEAIRRKALPPEKEAFISMIGLALLIMLMIFATYNDILRKVTGG